MYQYLCVAIHARHRHTGAVTQIDRVSSLSSRPSALRCSWSGARRDHVVARSCWPMCLHICVSIGPRCECRLLSVRSSARVGYIISWVICTLVIGLPSLISAPVSCVMHCVSLLSGSAACVACCFFSHFLSFSRLLIRVFGPTFLALSLSLHLLSPYLAYPKVLFSVPCPVLATVPQGNVMPCRSSLSSSLVC